MVWHISLLAFPAAAGYNNLREGLIKSTCSDWRGKFLPGEAKNRRNTGCIARFFNDAGRKFFRQDGHGDLFRASLGIAMTSGYILKLFLILFLSRKSINRFFRGVYVEKTLCA